MTVQIRSKLLYWRSDQSEGEKRRLDKHLVDCSFSCAVSFDRRAEHTQLW